MATVKFTDCSEFGVDSRTFQQIDAKLIFAVADDLKDPVRRNDLVRIILRKKVIPDDIADLTWHLIDEGIYFAEMTKWQAWSVATKHPNYVTLAR